MQMTPRKIRKEGRSERAIVIIVGKRVIGPETVTLKGEERRAKDLSRKRKRIRRKTRIMEKGRRRKLLQ